MCGPGNPPARPLNLPPGVGLETPQPDTSTSPWVWAWRPSGQTPQPPPPGCGPGDLQGMLGYHLPPCGQSGQNS